MRPASSPRFFPLCAIAALLVACSPVAPLFIINRSGQPIHVRVSHPIKLDPSGKPMPCRYDGAAGGSMRMAPEGAKNASDFAQVVPTATDPAKCEIEFDLPAGYKVAIDSRQPCDDYAEHLARDPAFVPSPSALRMEGTKGIIDLSGWQVARQFKRKKDLSCLLVYE